jgi:hypothetical protein
VIALYGGVFEPTRIVLVAIALRAQCGTRLGKSGHADPVGWWHRVARRCAEPVRITRNVAKPQPKKNRLSKGGFLCKTD